MSAEESPARTVRIGLVQFRSSADPDENLARAREGLSAAASGGAQIVCLQELFRTPYFCQAEDPDRFGLAEPIPGPTTEVLASCAREREIVVVGSIFERRTEGMYHNTAVVLDADGSLVGTYRKMHVPDDPLYHEKYYFTPGDTGFVAFETRYARIAPMVCWDQWYPEAARLSALQGAQILFYPTAIGRLMEEEAQEGREQRESWEVVQRAHAISNGVFVAAVNRVGREGGIDFWGGSFACDPFGRILDRAGDSREEVLVIPCDLGLIEATRRAWPFLRDRRIDAYGGLTSRFLDSGR